MSGFTDILHVSAFYELTALLVLAAGVGFAGQLLRQPMIVSFIAAGILAGPAALGIVQSYESIELLAQLGVAVLLFLVGLKLDLKLIRAMSGVSLAAGLGQIAFTSGVGFLIGLKLGFDAVTSLYVAVALTFSSTIIIVKLLSDRHEVESLHGRISIGILIIQDLAVVLAMIVLSAFGAAGEEGGDSAFMQIGLIVAHGVALLLLIGLFIRYVATPLMNYMARSPELLVTFAIGWAALLAALCSHFGLSKELGGLLAGVSLASTPFREAIVSRLSSLRDFLLLFFFVGLGTHLDVSLFGEQIVPALIFAFFVLIGKPLIVMVIMGDMGYRKRTGFIAGLTMAQISEFSLIFMAMGLALGHISAGIMGLVTLSGLITIALSVYMITYSQTLYRWLEPMLGIFERRVPHREEADNCEHIESKAYDVILFGIGRYGTAIAHDLKKAGHAVLAVDFNPDIVKQWEAQGHDAMYGDACDQEFIAMLPLKEVKWVISAMPQHDIGVTHEDPRIVLIEGLRQQGYKGKIAVSTHSPGETEGLTAKGAHLVIQPFQDAADQAVRRMDLPLKTA